MSNWRDYVTLFDKNYLPFGITMYESLQTHSSRPFTLHVVAMDRETEKFLQENYPHGNIRTYYYKDVLATMGVDPDTIKDRTWAQTCWTMASASLYAMLWDKDEVTYLDADLYFFADPERAFEEMGDAEVAIVPHNFPAHDYERLRPSGLFNVSWVTARHDGGFVLIGEWFKDVLNKCDAESCGDQKYLDEWPDALGGQLHIFKSKGMGAGPWNAYTYDLWRDCAEGYVRVGSDDRLVFYHFHEFRRKGMERTGYPVSPEQAKLIYEPYEHHLEGVAKRVSILQSN